MIADWRKLFGQGDFPFYIVGLPAYMHHKDNPGDDSWAEFREAQAMVAKSVPDSCLATTVDTGNPDNIHPIDKLQVGERLAFCALACCSLAAMSAPMASAVRSTALVVTSTSASSFSC
jgi:sialate O-acetylesterase